MIFFVIVGLVMSNSAQIIAQLDGSECATPDGKRGFCINIKKCEVLVNILRQSGHPTSEDFDMLRRYNCGFERLDPKVCCPQVKVNTPSTTPPIPQTPETSSGITHPNVRLVNQNICGPVAERKIVGGNRTGVLDYPWMTLIAYNDSRAKWKCGGSVINNRYILTAAHCLTALPPGIVPVSVRVGEHDLRTERDCNKAPEGVEPECGERYQDFMIEEMHFHSGYKGLISEDDIGLIRVDSPIDLRPANVRPICLPIGDGARHNQQTGIVTGWGVTESGYRSQELLQVRVPLITNEECAKAYSPARKISNKQLCAGGSEHKDSCNGDSGGPLQIPAIFNKTDIKYVQYGIVSWGPRICGVKGYPGVYTKVNYYVDWILDHLKEFWIQLRCLLRWKLVLLKMIFLVFAFLIINSTIATAGDSCETPDGNAGMCIDIKECDVIGRALKLPGHPTREDVDMLRRSRCGFDGSQAREFKICCPGLRPETSSTQSTPSVTPAINPDPILSSRFDGSDDGHDPRPDVTTHRNLRLLDQQICGPLIEEKIIGGKKTGLFDYPWMALIAYKVYNNYIEFKCGGSVINNRYILTAAHCVAQLHPSLTLVGVRVGEHDQRTEKDCSESLDGTTICAESYQDFGIEEIHYHSEYKKSILQNDIGLIRVDSPIDFNPRNSRPICLPIGDAAANNPAKFIVTGWGKTEFGTGSPDLLHGRLTAISNEECQRAYKKTKEIWYKQMCAQGSQFSCLGDSGGPLQAPAIYNKTSVKFVQYGIVSFGTSDCNVPGYPSVYTRILYYTDWILDRLKE
ncbi:uncharacterized protein [Fopius arisanus]|uniref:limulus clotting factor C n=3 Tax=Fopius arisanus TaxID=64838 RepID=A0A9R1TS64_9HYME|nr:PREDICTED: uncharacterized protein LOC105273536 [Fopius arisanus]